MFALWVGTSRHLLARSSRCMQRQKTQAAHMRKRARMLTYSDTQTHAPAHVSTFYACVYTYTVYTYIHVPIPSSLPPPSHLSLSPSHHHRRSLLIPIRTCIVKITVMLQCPSHGWNMDSLAARWAYRKLESETSMCVCVYTVHLWICICICIC